MRNWLAVWALTAACFAFCSPAAGLTDPNQTYESLYGAESRKVAASYGKRDDAAFAGKLLEGARGAPDSPALQVLLCEKACEFGLRYRDGYAAAEEAARMLSSLAPARGGDCDATLLRIFRVRFRSARGGQRPAAGDELLRHLLSMAERREESGGTDEAVKHYREARLVASQLRSPRVKEISARIGAAASRERADRELVRLTKLLKEDPDDTAAARQVLLLHLIEKDDPAEAATFLRAGEADPVLSTCLPLATKPWDEIDEQVCLELGGWYLSLAGKASAGARPRMLARAKAYYEAYLTLHGKDDGPSLRAKTQLKRVDKLLEPVGKVLPGFVGPPEGVTTEILAWAKQRDALPPEQQLAALKKKLSEVNGGKAIGIRGHRVQDGRLVALTTEMTKDLVSIAPLHGMRLTRLCAVSTAIESLEPLRGMKLKSLDLRSCTSLASLKGIEGMPLTELELYQAPVTSLEPLRGMKLTRLSTQWCTKLEGLRGMEGMPLTELDMRACRLVQSIEPLRGMRIRKLHVGDCIALRSLTPIQGMPLVELHLDHLSLTDLTLLKGMKLERLGLRGCRSLRSLKGIEDMPLKHLELTDTAFARKSTAAELMRRMPTLTKVVIE